MPKFAGPRTSYADMLLIRALYWPKDGGLRLTIQEIADKFEIPRSRVYTIVMMSEWRLENVKAREFNGRGDAERIDPAV